MDKQTVSNGTLAVHDNQRTPMMIKVESVKMAKELIRLNGWRFCEFYAYDGRKFHLEVSSG